MLWRLRIPAVVGVRIERGDGVSVEKVSTFVAVLSLLCAAGSALTLGLLIVRRWWPEVVRPVLDGLADVSLWLAATVATVCTVGSLYYSEIAGYLPCELCWFQRICVYPLSATLIIAAVRRDRDIWRYVVVPAAVGLVIAVYHTQLQAFPEQKSFCPTEVPCTARYVWEFGFVSLPFMALTAFVFILLMMRVSTLPQSRASDETAGHRPSRKGDR